MDNAALVRLMTWLSPAYPVGGYSYSHGIEWAVETGAITGRAELESWIGEILLHGSGHNDGILFAHAHRNAAAGDRSALGEVAEIAAAFNASSERHLETTAQGDAFLDVTAQVWPCEAVELLRAAWDGPVAYPVAVAATAAGHGIAGAPALTAYLHVFAANLVSAGVRLVPLGQTDGQRAIATLLSASDEAAANAFVTGLDDLGGGAIMADLAAMHHETQDTRLFRS